MDELFTHDEFQIINSHLLARLPKSELVGLYIAESGWIGGLHHPSRWTRGELVTGLIEARYRAYCQTNGQRVN